MNQVWRLVEVSAEDAALNLAIDEALLRSRAAGEGPNTLRLWRNPPCIVIGAAQNPLAEVNLSACEELGLPVLRRQSGGGAVYHDGGNLNYSLAVDSTALAGHTSTEASYRFLLKGVLAALGRFGLEGSLRNISDVYVGERKIAGCAQYRTSGGILHHGCLLVKADLSVLERTLRVPVAWYREVVNLADLVTPEPAWRAAAGAVAAAYGELFRVELEPGDLTAEERARAETLRAEKYGRHDWTMRVPPGWKPGRYGPRETSPARS